MLEKIIPLLCVSSFVYSLFAGTLPDLGVAILQSGGKAVTLTLTLLGVMCFWNGLMTLWEKIGAVRGLSRLLSPFLRLAFPEASRNEECREALAASLSANMLGIGNAAMPLSLRAMQKMQVLQKPNEQGTASPDMITLTAMSSCPITLFPTTVLSLRAAAGSGDPGCVLFPIWICSLAGNLLTVFLCRLCSRIFRK